MLAAMDSPYDLLDITADATPTQVRGAYLRAMRRVHPDMSGAARHEEAVRLNAAYAVLADPEARAAYDAAHGIHLDAAVPEPARFAPPAHPQGFDRGSWDIPDWPR